MSGVGTEVNQAFPAVYSEQPISLKNDPYTECRKSSGISTIRTQVIAGVATAGIDAIEPDGSGVGVGSQVGVSTLVGLVS